MNHIDAQDFSLICYDYRGLYRKFPAWLDRFEACSQSTAVVLISCVGRHMVWAPETEP